MLDDLPPQYLLTYLVGEIVINDSFAEHEARVYWNTFREMKLTEAAYERDFGRLLPQLRTLLDGGQVPDPLRKWAVKAVDEGMRAHKYRKDLVHDLLVQGSSSNGNLLSAFQVHPPRSREQLAGASKALQRFRDRMRGLAIITPAWLSGKVDPYQTVPDMVSWTRVAMGHIADLPGVIQGIGGRAPEPPRGWAYLISEARRAEDTRLNTVRSLGVN